MEGARPAQRSRIEQNCEISLGASSSNDENNDAVCKIDDAVREYLPHHLVEVVLQQLPLVSICRFRAVCKQWYSSLNSSSFCQKFSGVPFIYATILMKANSGMLYDPVQKKWYRCIIPYLHGKDAHPLASAGSLICLWDTNDRRLCVANPLNNSVRPLPYIPRLFWPTMKVGMTLKGEDESSGYKIVSLKSSGSYAVYDSLENNWICCGWVHCRFSFVPESKAVSIGSVVYFLLKQPGGLLCYDTVDDMWVHLLFPPPDSLPGYFLVESDGRLLLLKAVSGRVCCLQVWELSDLVRWDLISETSTNFCADLNWSNVRMDCVSNQKQIMVALSSEAQTCLLTYNAPEAEWVRNVSQLPPGMERITRQQKALLGTSFIPSFRASA